jgi:hypothetical protein
MSRQKDPSLEMYPAKPIPIVAMKIVQKQLASSLIKKQHVGEVLTVPIKESLTILKLKIL